MKPGTAASKASNPCIFPPGLVFFRHLGTVIPHLNPPCFSISVFHRLKAGALAHVLPKRWILDSIDRNSFSGTATSAIWKIVIREWETILAPILMSFSWMLESVQ